MKDAIEYERPNTVSGLVAKHAELSALRDRYKDEIKRIAEDLGHLDGAIRLFEPDASCYALRSSVAKSRARKGAVKRFILDQFRNASEPITSRQITEAWAADQGLGSDEATLNEQRKRIGACMRGCVHQGLIVDVGLTGDHDRSGPYKLWVLKKGGQ